ncbi:MAG: Ku protein [Polyangiaceae bacterium]|nr:Ku protein [Polyangiaceae bacterium]
MKLFCPEDGHEYEFGEAARGYEVSPDRYVLVSDEELEGLRPESNRSIEIIDFVALDEIDPIFYDRPYHLAPDKGGAKPYRLLAEAMKKSERVAIARFVMRSRGYLAVLRPLEESLLLCTMRYRDEVVMPEEVEGLSPDIELSTKELEMAERLIESMRVGFDASAYRDEYREAVESMLQQKAEGKVITAKAGVERARGEVVDLMDALKKSLAESGRAGPTAKEDRPGPKKVEPERKKKAAPKKRAGGRR